MEDKARAAKEIKLITPANGGKEARIRATYRRLHELDRLDRELPREMRDRWFLGLVKRIWYGESARIDAWQMDCIRRANAIREIKTYKRLKGVADEFGEIDRQIAEMEAVLSFISANRDWTQSRHHRPVGGALDMPGIARRSYDYGKAGTVL